MRNFTKKKPRRSEAAIVKDVLAYLRSLGAKAIKTTPPGVEAGTPDIIACYKGWALTIETKAQGETPTALQSARLEQWRAAGALTLVAWSVEDVKIFLARRGLPV